MGAPATETTAASGDGGPSTPAIVAYPPRRRIGRYEVLQQIGAGGMGVVFAAYDSVLDRQVAIKLVRSDRADPTSQTRMLREGRALARLSHPNVVAVHEVNVSVGQIFLVMEYVKGITLRAWTAASVHPTAEVIDMFVQVGRGLAAAHAQGMIHRDFKPENVLIGVDGRPRVVDFGLVTDPGRPPDDRDLTDVPAGEEPRLTWTGAFPGTPAYMAPEQALGRGADARSDQFSFCVALYEAVCGERPFAGKTTVEIQSAASASAIRPPARGVPEWLVTTLRRGLSPEPGDRWPSMDVLLSVLSHDPLAARRRRVRLAALLLLVAAVVALTMLAIAESRRRGSARRLESDAAEQLAVAEDRIAAARARNDPEAAARTFADFVADPRFRDTAAFTRAWLDEAARRRDDQADDRASEAYAQAFFRARTSEHVLAALDGLAAMFHARRRWPALTAVLATIDRVDPEAARARTRQDLALAAALGQRDVHAARGLLAADAPVGVHALLGRLSLGAAVPDLDNVPNLAGMDARVDLEGDGTPELLLRWQDAAGVRVDVVRADRSLTRVASYTASDLPAPRPDRLVPLVPDLDGGFSLLGSHSAPTGSFFTLLRPTSAYALEVQYTGPGMGVFTGIRGDLDRDGVAEVYVGAGPDGRRLVELTRDPGGILRTRLPIAPGDEPASDIQDLRIADLDGDGRDELVMATGPWRSYDVRVYRRGDDGLLHLVDRDMLGMVWSLQLVHRGDELLIAASHTRVYPSRLMFPAATPTGEPPGVYLLRLSGDRLERVDFLPLPGEALSDGAELRRPADLDGDGREDLVLSYDREGSRETIFFLQTHDGRFTPVPLGQTTFLGDAELDGDPTPEALLVLGPDRHSGAVWIVGGGDDPLPTALPATTDPADPPVRSDAWSRASDLRAMGLDVSAADAFVELARDDPGLRGPALLASARLLERAGAVERAASSYAQVAEQPGLVEHGLRGVYRARLRLGESAAAAAALRRLLDLPGLPDHPSLAREHERLQAVAGGLARSTLTFDHPLDPRWTIRDPLAVRRDSAAATLDLDAAASGVLAVYPVNLTSDHVEIDLDVTLEIMEWSAALHVELVPAGTDESILSVRARATGGGRNTARTFQCGFGRRPVAPHHGELHTATDLVQRVRLRVASLRSLAEHACTLRQASGAAIVEPARDPMTPSAITSGRHDLVLRISTQEDPARLRAKIHSISLTGAVPIDATTDDPDRALVGALVEGAYGDAIGLARAHAGDAMRRLWAADLTLRAGDLVTARDELVTLLQTRDPAVDAALVSLLRRDPELYAPVLWSAAPGTFLALFVRAWSTAVRQHIDEPRVQEGLLDVVGRVDIAALVGPERSPAAAELASTLLTWRALVHVRQRRHDAAHRDLTAALDLTRRALADPRGILRRDLQIELAVLAAIRGDMTSARTFADAAVVDSVNKTAARDMLNARDELRTLLSAPP